MKSSPLHKKALVLAGTKAQWSFKGLRCRLNAAPDGVTVNMKGGNRSPGDPGEGFEFFKAFKSLPEALVFVESLPTNFGPDDAERLGFIRTGWALYD